MLGVFGLVTENEEMAQLVADSQRDDELVDLVNHAMNVVADNHTYHYVHMFVGRFFDQKVELLDELGYPTKKEVIEGMINRASLEWTGSSFRVVVNYTGTASWGPVDGTIFIHNRRF
jgi:hypothetical protein